MSEVDQADLQGNILCGYGRRYAHGLFFFFRIERPHDFRQWLSANAEAITTAVPWNGGNAPKATLNVALSFAGLKRLELPESMLNGFPADFREGMEARAGKLGDTDNSDPAFWDNRLKGLHGVITVLTLERLVRGERKLALEAEAADAGLDAVYVLETEVLEKGKEPFGFADGISQPQIRDRNAGPTERAGDVPVAPGEFVLGYMDEGGVNASGPEEIGMSGSYMVVRKLEQDVDGFWDFFEDQARGDPELAERLASKVVGRWKDGTPLVLSPYAPGGDAVERDILNDFTYAGDRDGFRCPIGAHIRRTNPRDSLHDDWRFANRHRIIRRGMPYRSDDPAYKPGLIFVCFQASIARQFEFVQSLWMGDGNAFGLGSDPDFIAGPSEGKMTIQGAPPRFVPMRRFVTTRGGDYFFAPGIAALKRIAAAA